MYYYISYTDQWHNLQSCVTSYHPVEWLARTLAEDNKRPYIGPHKAIVINFVLEFTEEQFDQIVDSLTKDGITPDLFMEMGK